MRTHRLELSRTSRARGLLVGCTLAGILGCAPSVTVAPDADASARPASPRTSDLDELRAFARLYGYIRFFHPSDEAATVDWDAFAVHGVREVTAAEDQAGLRRILGELFAPIAPTLEIVDIGDVTAPAPAPAPLDGAPEGASWVAWQHRGYGFSDTSFVYRSHRTDRRQEFKVGDDWAPIVQAVDGKKHRGKRVRLRGRVRVEGGEDRASAALWPRVDRDASRAGGFFDNMQDRPLRGSTWTEVELEGPVADDAAEIVFGGMVNGAGTFWFDDFTLEIGDDGRWAPLQLQNPGFEADPPRLDPLPEDEPDLRSRVVGWNAVSFGYDFATVAEGAAAGERALQVKRKTVVVDAPLFAAKPAHGERIQRPLGAGMAARFPISLPSTDGHTHPRAAAPMPALKLSAKERVGKEPAARVAAVVIAWNVLRHFYPYFDVVDADWDEALDDGLRDALDDEDAKELGLTLRRLSARLRDGHAVVVGPSPWPVATPVRLEEIEGAVVVVAAADDTGLRPGDEVVAIDGAPIAELYAERARYVSGSPQWIRHRLLAYSGITAGPPGSDASFTIRRDGAEQTIAVARGDGEPPPAFTHAKIEALARGVYYVDLGRASWAEIEARLGDLARARGIIFDLREYPNGNDQILRHMLAGPDEREWMFIPEMIYPDQEKVAGHDASGWALRPAKPRLTARVVFLTGSGAISYAESVMGYVAHHRMGEIVGGPTAGANGNVVAFSVPGGFTIRFTGMKVLHHDGGQHHVVGVTPTIAASRTRAGVKAGRDELRERALEVIQRSGPAK